MRALNLGCGEFPIDGFENYDIRSFSNPSINYTDVTNEFPFESDSIDYIYSKHLIEHLTFTGFGNYLYESLRCLKKGGIHRICFSSLDQIKNMIMHPNDYETYFKNELMNFNKIESIEYNFSEYIPYCFAINNLYTKWNHKNIYDVKTIKLLAKKIGYEDAYDVNLNESNVEIFKNIERIQNEQHFEMFAKYESNVIELIK
jgi:ubiquinone/menaquinone biosynthesis C-methylase UbiE